MTKGRRREAALGLLHAVCPIKCKEGAAGHALARQDDRLGRLRLALQLR